MSPASTTGADTGGNARRGHLGRRGWRRNVQGAFRKGRNVRGALRNGRNVLGTLRSGRFRAHALREVQGGPPGSGPRRRGRGGRERGPFLDAQERQGATVVSREGFRR